MRAGSVKTGAITLPAADGTNGQAIKTDGSAVCSFITAGGSNPTGAIVAWSVATAPTGYLLCDGTSYAVANYAALWAVIGDTFGGDGGTNFNVPDIKGRVIVGKSADTEFDTIGETGGSKTHTLTEAQLPSHTHTLMNNTTAPRRSTTAPGVAGITATSANTGSAGSNTAHNNLQPYITLKYIIKT